MFNANSHVRLLLIANALVVQAACGPPQPAGRTDGALDALPLYEGYYTPRIERDSLLRVLAANERHWNGARLQQYTATMRIGCGICPTAVLVLDVDGGVVVPRRDRAGKQIPEHNPFAVFTIDSVFRFAETAIRDSGQRVRVWYDADLGYPREIITDHPYIMDSDRRIRLDSVRGVTLPGTRVAPPT